MDQSTLFEEKEAGASVDATVMALFFFLSELENISSIKDEQRIAIKAFLCSLITLTVMHCGSR